MSRGGKKGSKATPETTAWDEGLLNAVVEEDNWRPYLIFVCPNTINDEPHIEVLKSAVSAGTRRRFCLIDKNSMLQSATDDVKLAQSATAGGGGKKGKAAVTPLVQKPMFVEVCEQVVDAMKSGSQPSPSLLARMIKYKVLRQKTAYRTAIAEKEATEAAKKQAAEKGSDKGGKGGKGGGGRASKAGKKGKETPAADSGPAISLPEKPPTSMKKRGEEDLDSKYIDDEPAGGPTSYFIMTGFTSLDVLEQLSPVGLTAHVLMNIKGGTAPPLPLPPSDTQTNESEIDEEERLKESQEQQHENELLHFWNRLGRCVQATEDGHMLRDMARVEYTLSQPLVHEDSDEKDLYGKSLFDCVSEMIYHVLKQNIQYHHYLKYLRLRQLSVPSGAVREQSLTNSQSLSLSIQQGDTVERVMSGRTDTQPSVDLTHYNQLLSTVPQKSITIPLILHCMKEQVCVSLSPAVDTNPSLPTTTQQVMHDDVLAEITNSITGLCIPNSTKKILIPGQETLNTNTERVTASIEHWDQMKVLSHNLSDIEPLNIRSSQTNSTALLSTILSPPQATKDEQNVHLAMLHAVQHHCISSDVSAQSLNHALIVFSLEHIQLPSAASIPGVVLNPAPLQFDHSFDITVRDKSGSVALVPYNNGSTTMQYQLELSLPTCNYSLGDYTVCEPMSKGSLLQLLQSLQHTHPYLSVYNHKLTESTLIVVHCGFDGKPLHTYSWQSLAHSRVGFSNYLQYIAEQFGEDVDKAVEEDEERREALEEECQKLIDARKKGLEQQQMEMIKEEQEDPVTSAKGGKKSAAASAKKTPSGKKTSKMDVSCTTPEPANDSTDIEDNLPKFEERTLYEAYDVGDAVLLNRGNVSVQFLSDGSQIYTEQRTRSESDMMLTVSTLCDGHKVSCSMIKEAVENEIVRKRESKEDETNTNENDQCVAAAGIPQPPVGLKFASVTADFSDSLHLSVSHFGPKGNGELPYEPIKPTILLESEPSDIASDSRPQSRQTPQKMNKKQLEQQQQLLEQQRKLEEQKQKEREEAQREYNARHSALLRQNKYQQLFATTPYGLHVHCQVNVGPDTDPTIMDGSDGSMIVQQSYPIQHYNKQQQKKLRSNLTAFSELKRYYLPDGSVLCFMKDGSLSVLCPDGHIYQTATKALNDLYNQNQQNQDSSSDDVEPTVQPTFSDTKVTFANQIPMEVPLKRSISDTVWVVTTPSGQRYLWKSHDNKPTDKPDNEESEETTSGQTDGVTETPDPRMLQQTKVVPLPSAQVLSATDPVTKQVLMNREDKVTMLMDPDSSFVVQYADGTRVTTKANSNDPSTPIEVMAECPGFARVTHTASRQCLIDFPDGSNIAGSTNGHYTVKKEDGYKFEVKPYGESQYLFQPKESKAYSFTLNHTGVGDILKAKSRASKVDYTVSQDGTPAVSNNKTVPSHPAFSPRYFVVPNNGSPYQLLTRTEMNLFLTEMESQTGTTVVKGVQLPGFEGSTVSVMKALPNNMNEILPYKNDDIIPKNLSLNPGQNSQSKTTKEKKRFGVGVGKSLSILSNMNTSTLQQVEIPTAFQCRQFADFEQFNDKLCKQICDGLTSYIVARQEQKRTEDDLLPVDHRDVHERQAASDLKAAWLTKVSGNILSQALQDIHQQTPVKIDDSEEEAAKQSSMKALNSIKQDLEQAELDRAALRNHTVPRYFESSKGQQFLRSQSPDMALLARQLAQPKHRAPSTQPNELSHSSTPSTLQSASIILRPVGGDSPDVGEVDTISVSSANKIRPAHPTPDHAQGMYTPTDVRPTNPTPYHANRPLHSPAASIISQPDTIKIPKRNGTILESESTAERSVSFMLPPRRPSIVEGESFVQTQTSNGHNSSLATNKPNIKFNEIEGSVRRKVRTSSTMTNSGLVQGLEVQPQSLNFGAVKEGCTYALTLVLKNVGIDSCRFKIKQPPPSTGIKVIFTPGPVAAGMSRKCDVELFAVAVGVVGSSGTGYINHNLEVVSEANILQIPVQAAVLTASEYEAKQTDSQSQLEVVETVGVRQINRPSSREDYTRRPRASGMADT